MFSKSFLYFDKPRIILRRNALTAYNRLLQEALSITHKYEQTTRLTIHADWLTNIGLYKWHTFRSAYVIVRIICHVINDFFICAYYFIINDDALYWLVYNVTANYIYWGENILSPQYLVDYWGEWLCCPCGVGASVATCVCNLTFIDELAAKHASEVSQLIK
jgi:hypothetical protein